MVLRGARYGFPFFLLAVGFVTMHADTTLNTTPASDLYHEKYRPQFHFTARQWTIHKLNPQRREEGWVNDLNGLIYLDGEYHLFAQRWNKCWIHAVSSDLVHWTELQPAFWEDANFGGGVQSGGAVLDVHNVSGLSPDPATPPLIAFWSGNDNKSQCISYSLDRGRTWTKYAKNPLFVHPERDPKVFWYAPTNKWIMLLSEGETYLFFTSDNLLDWTEQKGRIPNSYECPDFFQLPVDGDSQELKWVLIRGNGFYSVGEFDGHAFHEDAPQSISDFGPHFYATQSWEGPNARRIQLAWMREGSYPDMPFNQQLTFPCELTLHREGTAVKLFRKPVPEIAGIQGPAQPLRNVALSPGAKLSLASSGDLFRLVLHVDFSAGSTLIVNVRGTAIEAGGMAVSSGHASSVSPHPIIEMEMLIDRTSIETFTNNGELSMSQCFLPTGNEISLECKGAPLTLVDGKVYPLRSIWP